MEGQVWRGAAPGRLDFLGGVADYSGSLVLQTPIDAITRVTVTGHETPEAHFSSGTESDAVSVPLEWLDELRALEAGAWRARLDERQVPRWARYSLGSLLLFCQAHDWWPPHGLNFRIESKVPASMGVSSSAALEVATLRALEQLAGKSFTGTALARLAQRAENEVVGAPCGLMDQLASSHGVAGALLPIVCRPDILAETVPLPPGVVAVGWPSGVKHDVADSPYATARAAAFMGKKMLEHALGKPLAYLTELSPSQVRDIGEEVLPKAMCGAEFLGRFGQVDDSLSTIEPGRPYPIRAGASFPVEENFRCRLAAQLLRTCTDANREEVLQSVGELMFQSHVGYSSIGLGSPETDAMVRAVREQGPEQGFFGARVSGGGSGGTVVVLLRQDALPALQSLANRMGGAGNGEWPLIR